LVGAPGIPRSPSIPEADASGAIRIGRYALHGILAAGGMATVHLARLVGEAGFSRTVAVKRLHPNFAQEQEFVAMLLDEARLVARIRHPNVVPMLDVVREPNELFLVMEYVHGESLSRLIAAAAKRSEPIPLPVASAVIIDTLNGLHAAHEARSERGEPLGLVHRDVSPQNAIVGVDGVTRVLDFGVAKASGRLQSTQNDELKGKLAYMSPQQIMAEAVDRRADVWSAAVCLWETITGKRLFRAEVQATVAVKVLNDEIPPPSKYRPDCPPELDAVVMKGLSRSLDTRYADAGEMAAALESAVRPATVRAVGEWVRNLAGEALSSRATRIEEIESSVEAMPSLSSLLAAPVESPSGRSLPVPPASHPSQVSQVGAAAFEQSATGTRVGLVRDELFRPEPPRSRGGIIIGAVILSVAVLAGALIISRSSSSTSAGANVTSSAPRAETSGSVPGAKASAEATSAVVAAVASSVTTQPSSAPSAASSVAPSTAPSGKKPAPVVKPPTPRPTAAPTTPAPNCSPNFVMENGIKKIKPECLN
jgi:serine/threonine-protein kinase